MEHLRPAVFLDRDGTINTEKEYLHRPEDLEIIPGAGEAIALLRSAGYLVVVVTNQSGVSRGMYDEAAVELLHRRIEEVLAPVGAVVDGWYFCPHHPEQGIGDYRVRCDCRKPLPGMLLQAAADLGIDLARSFMVGDKLIDIQAGMGAGCRSIMVRTGYGELESRELPEGVPLCDDLITAARAIVAGSV